MSINISSNLGRRARAAALALPLATMLVTGAALLPPAQAAPAQTSTSDLFRFSDGSTVDGASSRLPSQFRSFAGACTPESSFGLGDGPATCTDLQGAVHETS